MKKPDEMLLSEPIEILADISESSLMKLWSMDIQVISDLTSRTEVQFKKELANALSYLKIRDKTDLCLKVTGEVRRSLDKIGLAFKGNSKKLRRKKVKMSLSTPTEEYMARKILDDMFLLFKEFREAPNDETAIQKRNEIAVKYLHYIKKKTDLKKNISDPIIDSNDLFQEGCIALLNIIEKYDYTQNIKFTTYLEYRIVGAILDLFRATSFITRGAKERFNNVDARRRKLIAQHNTQPTIEDIARALNMPSEQINNVLAMNRQRHFVSLYQPIREDKDTSEKTLADVFPDESPLIDQRLEQMEFEKAVRRLLRDPVLSDNERISMDLYFFGEYSMKQIGEYLGLTESRISQMVSESLKKLNSPKNRNIMRNHIDLLQ